MIYKIYNRLTLYKKKCISFFIFSFSMKMKQIKVTFESIPLLTQKTVFKGKGTIEFGRGIMLGVSSSPYACTGEFYIEARKKNAKVIIGSHVYINNNAVIIADKSEIKIGSDTLIGPNFMCFDSNFHSLDPNERLSDSKSLSRPVNIGKNVFIGANVTILRGCNIGENSVIGAGCVISENIPSNSIVSCSSSNKITKLTTKSNSYT